MRVLHAPRNIAGQPAAFVKQLRQRGIHAELLVFKEQPFRGGQDHNLGFHPRQSHLLKALLAVRAFVQAAPHYDIFHYHTGTTFLYPLRWDLPILKALKKKIIFQFWGSDVRGKQPEEMGFVRYADAIIVGSYHMLDSVPKDSHVILPGLDFADWPPPRQDQPSKATVRVLHAPSSRKRKGTEHVLAAIEELRRREVPLELVLVENTPNVEALDIYRSCDIAVDQIAAGWYGVFAMETMALGKAVMGYIKSENSDRLEAARGVRPPLVNIAPRTLADALEELIRSPERRLAVGRQCREYVEQLHDIRESTELLLDIYHQV